MVQPVWALPLAAAQEPERVVGLAQVLAPAAPEQEQQQEQEQEQE